MAHNFESGFFHKKPAWHGLGVVVDEAPKTWDEARKLAGLDWDPILLPLRGRDLVPSGVSETGEPIYEWNRDVPGFVERVRSDTGASLCVGPVTYELITNTDMGLIMDVIMGDEKRHWETAGVLEGGRKVWCLVELGDPIQIARDPSPTRRYVAILNSHDGQTSCKAISTMVRIVCANTFHAAELDAAKNEACYTFTHTKNWRERLDEIGRQARAAIQGAQDQVEAYRLEAERLAALPVTAHAERRFTDELIFPSAKDAELKPRALKNVQDARARVVELLNSPTCEGIRGTAYGLLQAGGEYADHVRPSQTRETLFRRAVLQVDDIKRRAYSLAVAAGAGQLDD
jgi:phage/plasmid-like protein (TIGR03299 family)